METYARPSPRLWLARQTVIAMGGAVLVALLAAGGAAIGDGRMAAAGAGLAIVLVAAAWWVERGRYRAWGYAERDEDLVVRRGLLFRRLTVVPFGRMQFVDVSAGPVDRLFDLATVQLHTAAAATDARIPGLRTADATRLRDRLAALGEARSSGL